MHNIFRNEIYSVNLTTQDLNRCLFNRRGFIDHQNSVFKSLTLVFSLYRNDDKKSLACIDFSNQGNSDRWYTPVTGAFSHFEAIKNLSFLEIELLIEKASGYLLSHKLAKSITWRTPPLYFNAENTNKLHNVLFRLGWKVNASELNFHMPVSVDHTFRSLLGKTKRNEINRLERSEVKFSIAHSELEIADIYKVIHENHIFRGYPMTMSLSRLLALRQALPEDIFFASLNRADNILAGAILLRLDMSSLYIFNWGEHPDFRQESPITGLCRHLYDFAANNQYKFLDIGISTENSIPNQGLVNFKTNIGCQMSQKYVFEYSKSTDNR